jgi:hypothetical protein
MEHEEGVVEPRRRAREGGEPIQFGIVEFSPTRSVGPPRIQIDVQIAYDLCFGRSIYARKVKEITFPMALFPCPTKIRVARNHQNSTNFQNRFWCCTTILARCAVYPVGVH